MIDTKPDPEVGGGPEELPAATPEVFVIGAGVVGTALAARLSRAGVPVAGVHGRRTDLSLAAGALPGVLASSGELPDVVSDSDVILVAVRDERIPEIAERLVREGRLRPGQVILHTSGAYPAGEVLAAAAGKVKGLGTLHPLLSFADPVIAVASLQGAAFGIEGDPAARAAALGLVRAMGGRPLLLEGKNMALYHTGAVVASSYVLALADVARSMLVAAGVPEKDALPALLPLIGSAVRSLAEVGLPQALTGPVVRGDVRSVERHLETLAARVPAAMDIYRALGRQVLRMAGLRKNLAPEAAARLDALFEIGAGLLGPESAPKRRRGRR